MSLNAALKYFCLSRNSSCNISQELQYFTVLFVNFYHKISSTKVNLVCPPPPQIHPPILCLVTDPLSRLQSRTGWSEQKHPFPTLFIFRYIHGMVMKLVFYVKNPKILILLVVNVKTAFHCTPRFLPRVYPRNRKFNHKIITPS